MKPVSPNPIRHYSQLIEDLSQTPTPRKTGLSDLGPGSDFNPSLPGHPTTPPPMSEPPARRPREEDDDSAGGQYDSSSKKARIFVARQVSQYMPVLRVRKTNVDMCMLERLASAAASKRHDVMKTIPAVYARR